MVRISSTMTTGEPIQARTTSYAAPLIITSASANHTTSGISATPASRCEHHPEGEIERADRQRDAGGAVQDGQHGGELRLVDLQMRGKRPVHRPVGDAHRVKTSTAEIG